MESEDTHNRAIQIIEEGQRIIEPLLATYQGWEYLGQDNDTDGYRMYNQAGLSMIKAVGYIQASPQQIIQLLGDDSRKKELDEMLQQHSRLEVFDDGIRISHHVMGAPWPVYPRDFVFVAKEIQTEEGFIILARSIDGVLPQKDGVVRAHMDVGCYQLKRQGQGTLVTYLVSVDPKGSVPKFAVNLASQKQASKVHKLRVALGR